MTRRRLSFGGDRSQYRDLRTIVPTHHHRSTQREKGSYNITKNLLENAGLDQCCLLLIPPYLPIKRDTLDRMVQLIQKTRTIHLHRFGASLWEL